MAARVELERDAARHEATMARVEIEAASNARSQMESELDRVQCALVASE